MAIYEWIRQTHGPRAHTIEYRLRDTATGEVVEHLSAWLNERSLDDLSDRRARLTTAYARRGDTVIEADEYSTAPHGRRARE